MFISSGDDVTLRSDRSFNDCLTMSVSLIVNDASIDSPLAMNLLVPSLVSGDTVRCTVRMRV